jgi:hypothetical protein
LNFACIGGFRYYHTSQDNLEHVSERTLQHMGSSALALTRYFGNLKLDGSRGGSAVYFNIPGAPLVHYSRRWVGPLTGFAVALFAVIVAFGLRGGRLTLQGIFSGSSLSCSVDQHGCRHNYRLVDDQLAGQSHGRHFPRRQFEGPTLFAESCGGHDRSRVGALSVVMEKYQRRRFVGWWVALVAALDGVDESVLSGRELHVYLAAVF